MLKQERDDVFVEGFANVVQCLILFRSVSHYLSPCRMLAIVHGLGCVLSILRRARPSPRRAWRAP